MKLLIPTALAGALLAGCASGPDYVRPAIDIPAQFKEAPPGWKAALPADAAPRGVWWEAYGDPLLNGLVAQVEVNNQNVKVAEAAFRQARATAQEARAGFYPNVGASAKASRSRAAGASNNNYGLALDASWEPDLWGAVRRSVEAGDARSAVSAAQLQNVQLAAQAELVQDYLLLRIAEQQGQISADTVTAYQKSLQISRNQLKAGIITPLDVAQAEAQLKSAEAQRIDYDLSRRQYEHAIAVLIGKAPANFSVPASQTDIVLPTVPAALPSSLLERRPDIASAERSMAAANAQIGIAQVAWYPNLSLSGSAGASASAVSRLFDSPAGVWSLGAALAGTLFDGGARSARLEEAHAAYDGSVAQYRQTVLNGLLEVENNLASINLLAEEADRQAEAVKAAREAERLALNQYKAGTVDFTTVTTSQAARHQSEIAALQILGRRYAASSLLIKALGGGWSGPGNALAVN